MGNKVLSYVLTTFNKIEYLKVVLPELINNKKDDEEILVIDGGSNDGTYSYLEGLRDSGRIDFFLSEKDKGEAHGFNKGILLAKGELIKIITDDDAFFYPAIQKCREFMVNNPLIDVLGGNTGSISIDNKNSLFLAQDFQDDFLKWRDGKLKNFFFNGTCLMLRKTRLGLLSLFNSGGILTDLEYTLRITSVANLGWCSGLISVRILNADSNNQVFKTRADEDSARLCSYYNYLYPWDRRKMELEEQLAKRPLHRKIRSFIGKLKRRIFDSAYRNQVQLLDPFHSFKEAHDHCLAWLIEHPLNKEIRFFQRAN